MADDFGVSPVNVCDWGKKYKKDLEVKIFTGNGRCIKRNKNND